MKKIRANLFVSTTCAIAAILGHGGTPAQALTFNFTPASGTSRQAIDGFQQAGNLWSNLFTDNVTVNIDIAFTSLGSGILGQAGSSQGTISYTSFRNALSNDKKSTNDFIAVSNLTTNSAFNLLINHTSNNSNSATPYLDNNGNANNSTIQLTYANAKALGLLGANNTASDASISFSSDFAFDFDRSNGITAGQFDFVGVAVHEIGHALGFISGVDNLDYNPGFLDSNYRVTPLDLFRFSDASNAQKAIDFTADSRDKYFSIDGGVTKLLANAFSTGVNFGDGRQASHWKDNLNVGIMDPTFSYGELGIISSNDINALDVIGWNASTAAAVPEPLTVLGAMTAIVFGVGFKRKLIRHQAASKKSDT